LTEDDHDDRIFFSETLKSTSLNATLTFFENGEQLLHFLASSTLIPDIIFLDLKMPGMNGKECLKHIRADKTYNTIPVVIFTCTEYIDDIVETYKIGANLYVPKNFFVKNSVKALQMIIESTLNQSLLSPDKEKYVLGGTASVPSWNRPDA
jgi:CheY-like chemotaxis protein